jgi:hypothetical protein
MSQKLEDAFALLALATVDAEKLKESVVKIKGDISRSRTYHPNLKDASDEEIAKNSFLPEAYLDYRLKLAMQRLVLRLSKQVLEEERS